MTVLCGSGINYAFKYFAVLLLFLSTVESLGTKNVIS